MKVKVNGEDKRFDSDGLSIADLLKEAKVENPELVSVQLNQNFVERDTYETTKVSENDEIDFLYFMGGGR